MSKKTNLSLEPYKGTRDFYPEEQYIQDYIFSVMRRVVESYGYEPYNASILEEAGLYRAKSGEEIINEQTYTFTDRGGREVTLRPEMTPTVARMIAKKRQELSFPLRWYSIPNVFRYERPQRGRLREHWQLNADLFGVLGSNAEVEIITIASDLMKAFGAKEKDFEIRVNTNSKTFSKILQNSLGLDVDILQSLMRIIDKKEKISSSDFKKIAKGVLGTKVKQLENILNAKEPSDKTLLSILKEFSARGIKNVRFHPSLIRGFEYYTGVIFEVFDINKENPRALFGGGRYDELLDIFGVAPIPAVGFGMGDVTMRDFLETHKLLPRYIPKTEIYVCTMGEVSNYAEKIAMYFRQKGVNTAIDASEKKVGIKIKNAVKLNIPYIAVIGEDEAKNNTLSIKALETQEEWKLTKEESVEKILSRRVV